MRRLGVCWLTCLGLFGRLFASLLQSYAVAQTLASNDTSQTEVEPAYSPLRKNHSDFFPEAVKSPDRALPRPGRAGKSLIIYRRRLPPTRLSSRRVIVVFVALLVVGLLWRCARKLLTKKEVGAGTRLLSADKKVKGDALGSCEGGGGESGESDEGDSENLVQGAEGGDISEANLEQNFFEDPPPTPASIYAAIAQLATLCREKISLLPRRMRKNYANEVLKFGMQEVVALGSLAASDSLPARQAAIEALLKLGESVGGQRRTESGDYNALNPLMRMIEATVEQTLPASPARPSHVQESILRPSRLAVQYFYYATSSLMSFVLPSGAIPRDISSTYRFLLVFIRRIRRGQIMRDDAAAAFLRRVHAEVASQLTFGESAQATLQGLRGPGTAAAFIANLKDAVRSVSAGKGHMFLGAPWQDEEQYPSAPAPGVGQLPVPPTQQVQPPPLLTVPRHVAMSPYGPGPHVPLSFLLPPPFRQPIGPPHAPLGGQTLPLPTQQGLMAARPHATGPAYGHQPVSQTPPWVPLGHRYGPGPWPAQPPFTPPWHPRVPVRLPRPEYHQGPPSATAPWQSTQSRGSPAPGVDQGALTAAGSQQPPGPPNEPGLAAAIPLLSSAPWRFEGLWRVLGGGQPDSLPGPPFHPTAPGDTGASTSDAGSRAAAPGDEEATDGAGESKAGALGTDPSETGAQ